MNWKNVMKINKFPEGKGQGFFRFFKENGVYEEIHAISGNLYKDGVLVPITGLPTGFQGERQIEGVQFRDKLYIATGTKLVEYSEEGAKVIEAYTPQPLEALYIGTNALADNPNDFITDGSSAVLSIMGAVPDKRYGVVNNSTSIKIFVNKPPGDAEYKVEYKLLGASDYTLVQDWSADKNPSIRFTSIGDYEIKISARMKGDTLEENYFIPSYKVNEDNKANEAQDTSTIHSCNRILLHWNRLIMYGDPNQADMMYFSDLDRPNYFPTHGTLRYENDRREGLTALVEFRDMLIAFTPNSIQALFGKSPEDFNRVPLSTSIGCIAPYSAQVMGNYVTFLSQEGIHILKTLGYTEQRANVQKIDNPISNLIPRDEDANAVVADGQYQITFPQRQRRFRFYHQQGVWSKDESQKLSFIRSYEWNGEVFAQDQTGKVLRMDPTVWDDDGHVYVDRYVFKEFDFGEPYNPKKLKEFQLLTGSTGEVDLSVSLDGDGSSILSTDRSHAVVNDRGEVEWKVSGESNVRSTAGTTFGSWKLGESGFGEPKTRLHKLSVNGKCRRVHLEITNNLPQQNQILGVGFVYKLKKP